MPDKLTDNEIINETSEIIYKLSNLNKQYTGADMVWISVDYFRKILKNLRFLLNLINRQKAEIERLQNKLSTVRQDLVATIPIIKEELKTAKTEAYKEFAKFLIDKSQNSTISISDLPDYVAEMEGGASEVEN